MGNGDDKSFSKGELLGFAAMFACLAFVIWLSWWGTMKYAQHWHDGQHVEDAAR